MDLKDLVGHELAGFQLTSMIGQGGMAVVFRGENVINRSIVRAIKIVRPELAAREEFAARFAGEALTLERLSHENIVGFYGLRTQLHDGERLLVMELELLEGEPLSRLIRQRPDGAPLADGLRWIAMASRGVAAAHAQRVVHRDLKPDNLFLTNAGVVTVLDFGIARAIDDADRASRLTRDGAIPGSPPYMAPEVCRGALPDARADVYALGITLLEALLGHHPFVTPGEPARSSTQMMFAHVSEPLPSLRATRRDAPLELERIIERATSKEPSERYADAGQLAAALDALLPSLSSDIGADVRTSFVVPASKSTPTPTTARVVVAAKARRRWMLPAFGAVVALVVGVAIALQTRPDPRRPERTPLASAPADASADAGGDAGRAPVAMENRWVRVEPPSEPVILGVSSDDAPSTARGYRPARRIEAATWAFDIQQHEVTWSELEPWLAEHPDLVFERPTWVPADAAARARLPATGVPWDIARRYCASIDATLPAEPEWEHAARGAERRPMPWGSSPVDLMRTRVFAGPGGRPAEVMTHDQDRTPGGTNETVWDMLGNALEWTLEIYRDDLPDQDESWTQTEEGLSFRTVRGLSPRGPLPRPLQAEPAAYRDALCATGECPPSTREFLEIVGFRCARRAR